LEYITRIGGGCGWLPDCEELVGGTHLVKKRCLSNLSQSPKKQRIPQVVWILLLDALNIERLDGLTIYFQM